MESENRYSSKELEDSRKLEAKYEMKLKKVQNELIKQSHLDDIKDFIHGAGGVAAAAVAGNKYRDPSGDILANLENCQVNVQHCNYLRKGCNSSKHIYLFEYPEI